MLVNNKHVIIPIFLFFTFVFIYIYIFLVLMENIFELVFEYKSFPDQVFRIVPNIML